MQEIKTPLTDEEQANMQFLEITDNLVMGTTDPDKLTGSLVLPDCVTGICNRAFFECTALTRIVIPKSVTRIGKCAFTGCISLTELTVDSENPVYCSENNIIYTKDKKHLIAAAGGLKGHIVIPDGITKIGMRAFSDCTSLTKVEIPDSVSEITGFTFTGCISLTELTVDSENPVYCSENNIIYTKDKKHLIASAGGLNCVVIPDGVTKIGWRAFSDCTSLTKVEIPDSVTEIGSYAFTGCINLTELTVDWNSQ